MTLSNRISQPARATTRTVALPVQRFVTLDRAARVGSTTCAGMFRGPAPEVTDVARILIVDDDRSIRRTLEKFLGGEGYDVATAHDAPGAIASAATRRPHAARPRPARRQRVRRARRDRRTATHPPAIIVVTARDDMQSTVKAIQLGAYEYLVKPVDIDRLHARRQERARRAATRASSSSEFVSRKAEQHHVGDILGKSPQIRDVWKQIGAVSTTRAPVLIRGESGTGKELVAKAIHLASRRPRAAVRRGQLHRARARRPRERAVRPRQGRVHRRGRRPARPVRARRQGHAVPRRDRRDPDRPAGQAPARAAGAHVRARRRRAGRCRSRRA